MITNLQFDILYLCIFIEINRLKLSRLCTGKIKKKVQATIIKISSYCISAVYSPVKIR